MQRTNWRWWQAGGEKTVAKQRVCFMYLILGFYLFLRWSIIVYRQHTFKNSNDKSRWVVVVYVTYLVRVRTDGWNVSARF